MQRPAGAECGGSHCGDSPTPGLTVLRKGLRAWTTALEDHLGGPINRLQKRWPTQPRAPPYPPCSQTLNWTCADTGWHMELSEAAAQNQFGVHTGLTIGMHSVWAKNQPLPCSLCLTPRDLYSTSYRKERQKARMGRRDTASGSKGPPDPGLSEADSALRKPWAMDAAQHSQTVESHEAGVSLRTATYRYGLWSTAEARVLPTTPGIRRQELITWTTSSGGAQVKPML